jgi:serine/threonine-protein kinase TTK/MPS1
LEAVKTIHEEWIVHSDLKPANFLLVKGELQLLDFGITKAGQNYTTNIVQDFRYIIHTRLNPLVIMT